MVEFFAKGLVIGFSIAAPVGPIGVLCIRRTLADGLKAGFTSGLGAAVADALYGCVAGFGLAAISNFLVGQRFWLGLVGGIFLCWLGVRTFGSAPAREAANAKSGSLTANFLSTVALTLTNPATILSFVAVFAGFGLGQTAGDYTSAMILVTGVFLGSAFWWLILCAAVDRVRARLDWGRMRWVNRVSGLVLFAFGVAALVTLRR